MNWLRHASSFLEQFHLRKIQTIITLSTISITVFVVILVSYMLFDRFSKASEQNTYLNLNQIIEQVNANLELYVNGMEDIFEVAEEKINEGSTWSDAKLEEQLGTILGTREDLVSIALFSTEGELVRNVPAIPMRQNTKLTEQPWFEMAKKIQENCSLRRPIFKICSSGSTGGSFR